MATRNLAKYGSFVVVRNKNIKSIKMRKFVLFTLLCAVSMALITSCESDTKAKIEQCIENGDFTKARQLNKKLDYGGMKMKICRAQVSSLIEEGDFYLATDIAKEDTDYGVYYEILMGKLVQLYDNNPQGLMGAMASITFPTNNTKNWNGQYLPFTHKEDLNAFYETYNNNIKQLMIYAKASDDMDYVKKVSVLLKPLYKKVKGKVREWSNQLQETVEVDGMVWEDNPTDCSQADQIKKDLGIE